MIAESSINKTNFLLGQRVKWIYDIESQAKYSNTKFEIILAVDPICRSWYRDYKPQSVHRLQGPRSLNNLT